MSLRRRRQFSLFSVVQFDNVECRSSDTTSDTPNGICFTASECTERKGVKIANCAQGFGVCCMVKISECGSTVSQNRTYVQNPGFPTAFSPTTAENCQYNIQPLTSSKIVSSLILCMFSYYASLTILDICQIRLDFKKFEVNKNADGTCGADTRLTINGPTDEDPPVLCGTISGQHSNTFLKLTFSLLK